MTFRQLLRRATYLLRRRRREDDLVEEIDFHRTMTQRALEARGLDAATAGHETRRTLGGVLAARDEARDVWIWPWLQSVAQDLRFAARLLVKERRFTLVAVTALALGVGVNSVFFTVVNAICVRGLPIDGVDRVVAVGTRDARGARDRELGLSYRDFEDLRAGATAFAGLAAWSTATLAVGDEGRAPDRVIAVFVSADTFRLARETPRLGRDFTPADDRPGAPPVVILGHDLWQSRYGGDPTVIGRTVRVGGAPTTVVGVMPDGAKFPGGADLWQPLAQMANLAAPRDARVLSVFGRLADGATIPQADTEANTVAARLARQFPETNAGIRATVVPINDRYNSPITQPAWFAFITVGALLVAIACANVASLLLMRSARRAREIAIRAALGATRRRIVRQLLIESVLLATLGGAAGVWVSLLGAWLFESATPEGGLPYWVHFTMDARVFGTLAAVCLGTVLVFGLAPALHASKTDANDTLKEGGRSGSGGRRARRWTALFLTGEFALTMVLLAAVVDMTRSFLEQERTDLVIDTSHLLTMWVAPTGPRYQTPDARLALYQRLEDRLGAVASIGSAAIATALPFSGAPTRQLAIDNRPGATGTTAPTVWMVAIGPRYFETVGVTVLRGRAFTGTDGTPGHGHAIVNQRFADLHFPKEEVVGRRIRLTAPDAPPAVSAAPSTGGAPGTTAAATPPWLTIVGVSPNVRQRGRIEPDPVVYLPYRDDPPATAALLVRAQAEPGALTSLLRDEVRALDPDLPLYRVRTMEQVISELRWNPRLSRWLVTIVACIALALAAVGLHAVTSHAVAQRTQEIGIRLALGASARHVRWMVLRRALMPLAAGLVLGLICTRAFERLGSGAGPVEPFLTKPIIVVPAVTILALVAVAACLAPARRATTLDPVVALRHD